MSKSLKQVLKDQYKLFKYNKKVDKLFKAHSKFDRRKSPR